ncbi:MAG: type IV secretory system conjugative DNA transfer family protein [Gammaproteobacteria bacterium]|nr:type IV secretory system conjugative DNA transfer family protein [Gammaproteobacteria bacterium]
MPMPDVRKWLILVFLGIGIYLYLWGVVYYGWFTHSLEAFEQAPWFILQVLFEGNDSSKIPLFNTGLITLLSMAVIVISALHAKSQRNLYGDAHFARENEIQTAGLRAKQGILLGKYRWRFLSHDGDGHVLAYCPPGSGKGVGLVIPNLLNWPGSVVCLDIKNENFNKTSGFRQQHGQQCILFNPSDPEGRTFSYNPLDVIDPGSPTRINDVQKIAYILWPRHNDKGDIWNPSARSLFIATVLLQFDRVPGDTCIGDVLRFFNSATDIVGTIEEIVDVDHDLDSSCLRGFRGFLQKSEKERSGVLSSLRAGLELWENPLVDAATSRSDFDLTQLRTNPMSVYVGVTPDNIERMEPLLNMFFQQVIDLLTRKEPGDNEPHSVLMLLDEFTSLGRLSIVEKGIAYLRSYQVRVMPIIQGITQLDDKYGVAAAKSFRQNFKIKYISAPNDLETAREVSGMLGFKTMRTTNKSRQYPSGHSSVSTSLAKRELMLPHEVMQLKAKKAIVFIEASSPVLADKIVYYKSRIFKQRLLDPVSIPTVSLRTLSDRRTRLEEQYPGDAGTTNEASDAEIEEAMEVFQ